MNDALSGGRMSLGMTGLLTWQAGATKWKGCESA